MTRATTDAAGAATARARSMPLTAVDPPAAVIRALEDAALPRIDPDTARRITDLDRRFDRSVSALRQELARRQERAEEEPIRRPASGWDMAGFVIALLAAPFLLVGGPSGPAVPVALSVPLATWLVVAAVASHVLGALRARRDGSSVGSSRHLVLLSGLLALAVAALIPWRAGGIDGLSAAMCALSVLAAVAGGILFARASRDARSEAAERRASREAERARRADLEAELSVLIESARAESGELLGALTTAQRAELRAATTQAVRALGRRQLLEPAVLRELRTADAGRLRYAVHL